MHKISDAAKILGISRATAYNKIKTLDRKHIHKIEGIKYIDDKGLEILKSGGTIESEINKVNDRMESMRQDYIKTLKNQIEQLKSEIDTKNRQLEAKDKLLENFQVILKGEQDKALLLESKLEKEQSKSIWQRIFKK